MDLKAQVANAALPNSSFPATRGPAGVSHRMLRSRSQLSPRMWEASWAAACWKLADFQLPCTPRGGHGMGWRSPARGRGRRRRQTPGREGAPRGGRDAKQGWEREQGEENRSTFTGNSCKTPTHFCGTRIVPRAHREAKVGGDFFYGAHRYHF